MSRQSQQTPTLYTPDLSNTIKNLERDIKTLQAKVVNLQNLYGKSVSTSQLKLSEKRLKELIYANSTLISRLEEKLSLVSLPDETKYFLKQSEIEDFRSNFQKLAAMIADVNELYDSLVAYVSNTTTNSTR